MNKDVSSDEVSLIPKSEKDITEEWIEKVVGMIPIPNSVAFEGNIQDGVGFLSYMCRASFETEENGTQHIIVKLLPRTQEWKDLVVNASVDLREIQFYEKIKPNLTEMDPSLQANMCTFYSGKYSDRSGGIAEEGNPASMLVMEDLRPLGYHMYKPESELWEENLTKVVTSLARLHCASLTLERKRNSKISEMFPFCFGVSEANRIGFLDYAKSTVDKLDPLLAQNNQSSELRAIYQEMTKELESHFWIIMKETMKTPCLIHGDLWYSNIMIQEKSDAPVKFIDWQLVGYRDPTTELAPTLLACLPVNELRKETLDKFSGIYYDTCDALGDTLGRSRTEFQECFDTLGMGYAYLWFLTSIGTSVELEKRMCLIFDIMHKEYKLDEFLKNACK